MLKLLVQAFCRLCARSPYSQLVREISDVACPEVWQRVGSHIFGMGLLETRGYVRARAAAVVRRHADRTLQPVKNLDADFRAQIVAHARERTVQLVICDYVTARPVSRRRAA